MAESEDQSAQAAREVEQDEVLEQLRQLRIEDVLIQLATSLISLTYLRLGEEDRELDQAQLAIDALRVLLPLLEGRIPADLSRDLERAVSNLQLAYASAASSSEATGEDKAG